MKIFSLFIVICSVRAFACAPQEAEFIGAKIKSVTRSGDTCSFELNINPDKFWFSQLCALDIPDVMGRSVVFKIDANHLCNFKADDELDGYLSTTADGTITYER